MATYDPARRDATWQMVQPGCYIDPAGMGHIFPDEVIAFLQTLHPEAGFDAFSEADYEMVVQTFKNEMRAAHPGINFRFIKHVRTLD